MSSYQENRTKKQCVEEENLKKNEKSFTPREYQIEILEAAKENNTIACLGTGTGKTFIAVMLIREMANEVRLLFEDEGKRIFFLVPTVPLVYQQSKTINEHTDLEVKGYSGEMNVDSWNHEKWTEEFKANQVLVMTAEIFRMIVDHSFIPLNKIKLIVIDECHRAQGDHPYRQAMRCFTDMQPEEMPRIFGLSASLINGKCKPTQLEKQLRELEMTLKSTICTASDIADLQKYGSDPDECVIYFKPYIFESDWITRLRELKENIKKERKSFGDYDVNSFPSEAELIFFDKPLRCLNALEKTLEYLGPWCAHKAAEIFSEELGSLLLKCRVLNPEYREFLTEVKEFLIKFNEECKRLAPTFDQNNIGNWPHKLQRLLAIFVAVKQSKRFGKESMHDINAEFNDDPEQFHQMLKAQKNNSVEVCSIVFVEQRITAYVLLQWVREVKKIYPELNFLNPDFVVGHGTTGIKTSCMSEKQQKKALSDFRSKKCNVLISTNVLEEGMDVQQCNVVIRFDLPFDFRAYVQSKGRARAKNSVYILMVEVGEKASRFWTDMLSFKTVEKMLLDKCHDRVLPDEDDIKDYMADEYMPPYMPYGPKGPRITMISAISLINRYCSSLPSDMATKLTARWSITVLDEDSPVKEYKCTLKMPINSPLRTPIVGPVMPQKRLAKMAAALEACKKLYDEGELNEYLVPISCLVDKALDDEMGPIEEEDGNGAIPGTNRRRQIYDKHVPVFLQNAKPQPLSPSYLHVFKMELVEPLSQSLNPRKRPIINPADTSRGLGILLSKKLPVVNSFPVFTKFGKVKITVSLSDKTFILSESEIQLIEKFHKFIFADALYLDRGKTFSSETVEMSYYIVPVNIDSRSSSMSVIDFEFIKSTENHPYNFQKLKTSKTVGRSSFSEEMLKDAVLLKSYQVDSWKSEKPTLHHVICITDMVPTSCMDSLKGLSFKEYYRSKYKLEIQNDHQHLVETYQNAVLHQWKPIYINVRTAFDNSVPLSKHKQRYQNFREYFVPELCLKHPFPSSFFHKVLSLPTILFRLQSLLLAEELRQSVAASGLVGIVELPRGFHWPYFHLETSDKELENHLKNKGEFVYAPQDNSAPKDIRKHGSKIESFVNDVDLSSHPGPNPALLLQALTSKSTGDEFDLERLEMIGDSFLKYVMSVKTFMKYDKFDEGKLTRLRSRLIQNVHLYQKAKKRNLPQSLICTSFSCVTTWLPPCYTVEEVVEKNILNKKSKSEQEESDSNPKNHFFRKQVISDKCVADSVEALIGAYLLSCGQKGALMFMSWLGLNPLPHKKDSEVTREDFKNWPPAHPDPILVDAPNVQDVLRLHTDGFDKFEAKISYRFRDKALLFQAFTHPSYAYNEITDCYQRLEFLGDAVLDFLITRYLYEDPNDHSPGELTDLRSALVNNIYFASLAVKYEYHKYLKILSPTLFGQIKQYVALYQDSEAFKFFEQYGYHLEEIECFALDEVEVPKALGDLFESVAGAIYLDSGRSLDAVWKVCYPMMKNQMAHLTEHVPKSPVRELYEILASLNRKEIFTNYTQKEEKAYVEVNLPDGRKVVGVGPNKKVAKRSAAKRALAELKHAEKMDVD